MAAIISLLAFVIDSFIGDPQHWPHPVRYIGRLINYCEKKMRIGAAIPLPERLRTAGVVMVAMVLLSTMGTVSIALMAAAKIAWVLWFIAAVYLCYSVMCLKDLRLHCKRVEEALQNGDIEEARRRLSWIVGRETSKLDEADIRRALVETLAENFSDGIVAPMFYLMLGGPVLAWGYKAVNTLDSMVAYRNERYIDLGRFAAKLDDVANYIPARLSALLLVVAARFYGFDWQASLAVWRRDASMHDSPNAGHPESAMAGALRVWLGGVAYYHGQRHDKAMIYSEGREITAYDVWAADKLVLGASVLMLMVSLFVMLFATGKVGWFY